MRCLCWIIAIVIQLACLITMFISADEFVGGGDRFKKQDRRHFEVQVLRKGVICLPEVNGLPGIDAARADG